MKSSIFASQNLTGKHLVIADDNYSMHDRLADAAATFDAIIGQHIDDSYFGSARVMAPNRLVFGAIDADVTAGRQLTTNWDTVINSIKKNLSEIEHAPVALDFWANSAAIFAD